MTMLQNLEKKVVLYIDVKAQQVMQIPFVLCPQLTNIQMDIGGNIINMGNQLILPRENLAQKTRPMYHYQKKQGVKLCTV